MIPLYKPYMPAELPELEKILHSGALVYGKWGKEFESKLRSFVGVENLMTTNTYEMSIQIALTILGLKPEDEVIASPMSCLASNQPLNTFGLKVKWADIDPKSGTLSPNSVRQSISHKTKLIFHNHFCGYIGYVDEMNAIGREFGIPVIDDCIEAFGSKYKGNIAGNLGTDITIFSFQTVRLPNAIDGGAIVFKNNNLYEDALLARDYGIHRNIFGDQYGEISPLCDIATPGFGGTMSEVNSYIGSLQMDDLPELLVRQKVNSERWDVETELLKLNNRKEIDPNNWVYGILSENKIEDMHRFRAHGFYASGVHLPNTYYSLFGKQGQFPGVHEFYNKFIAVPCGWWFSK